MATDVPLFVVRATRDEASLAIGFAQVVHSTFGHLFHLYDQDYRKGVLGYLVTAVAITLAFYAGLEVVRPIMVHFVVRYGADIRVVEQVLPLTWLVTAGLAGLV